MPISLMRMCLTIARRIRIIGGMKFDDVLAALDAHKGSGDWRLISDRAGIHYDTIARIARRDMTQPSVQTVEKIAEALAALFPEPAKTGA